MKLTFLTLLAGLPALAGAARADTYSIHPTPGAGDFTSPAAALASPLVGPGDVLEVAPGTYVGTFVIDEPITLRSTAGAAVTVLDGGGSGPVIEVLAGATVRGFTITGAGGFVTVGGVWVKSVATTHLVDNVIVDNHPVGDVGIPAGGVAVAAGAYANLRHNEIRGNTSLSAGGIFAAGGSTLHCFRDRIHGNGGSGTINGGVLSGASGRFVDVQITGNHGSGIGGMFLAGGIPAPVGAVVEIVNCTIYGNFGGAPMGSVGGIFFDDGGTYTIRNTLLHSNLGASGGDLLLSSDFAFPPIAGVVDLDYSHVGTLGAGVLPGPHMLPMFFPPLLTAPVMATPFAPVPFGDFRPIASSPLVNAGSDAAFPADLPPIDARSSQRFYGLAIDIGAFELGRKVWRADPPASLE
jgi:hypothetical protein